MRTAIKTGVKIALFAQAAQRCQNPQCLRPLYLEQRADATHIAEIAHIVAVNESGPRGGHDMPAARRNELENLILLCPSCHTEIDKLPDEHDVATLQAWKAEHADRLNRAFGLSVFSSRAEARKVLKRLQQQNKQIFDTYGPHGDEMFNPESARADQWKRRMVDTIIPNSRLMLRLLSMNANLLTDAESEIVNRFQSHVADLTARHLDGRPLAGSVRYPAEMAEVLSDA